MGSVMAILAHLTLTPSSLLTPMELLSQLTNQLLLLPVLTILLPRECMEVFTLLQDLLLMLLAMALATVLVMLLMVDLLPTPMVLLSQLTSLLLLLPVLTTWPPMDTKH